MIWKVFCKILVSFSLVQNLEILHLAMTIDEKVTIAVTKLPQFFEVSLKFLLNFIKTCGLYYKSFAIIIYDRNVEFTIVMTVASTIKL
jgi:hypothetical protein